jgi:predicted DNA-binding transcriptional regulator YafY
MRASRLLGLLVTLQWRGRVSAQALAQAFEVSVRTIYRDVDALSAAGVPIYAEPGRHGGIALHKGYRTRLTGLTSAEAAALPIAHLAQAARDLGVSLEAAAAQGKLLASLPPEAAAGAQTVAARIHVDPIPWYHRAEDLAALPSLATAVLTERRITIAYDSWKGGVRRTLSPLGLVQKGGLWYLVAASRGRPRTYRVSNLTNMAILDTPAYRPAGFHLAQFWAASAQDFEARLMGRVAEVRISEEGERLLRAVMPVGAEKVAQTRTPDPVPGWSRAHLPFESEAYSARQILRLGAEIEVLSPQTLRRAVQAEIDAVRRLYRRPASP